MARNLLLFTLFALKIGLNVPRRSLEKVLSKHYYLHYTDESRLFVPFDSVQNARMEKGTINRNENYLVSKSNSGLGILEDSTCFYIDNSQRSIDVGPRSFIGNMLLLPLLDPYEIFNYAINNRMEFQKYIEDGKLIYDFISFKQDAPIISIVISFYNDDPDRFSIRLIYQQFGDLRQDIVRYKFMERPAKGASEKIADFLDFKNGRYLPKVAYKQFSFGNAYLIRPYK